MVMEPGSTVLEVQLQPSKLIVFVVGYADIENPPVDAGTYPVTALMLAFAFHIIASVLATPVAEAVTTVAHAPVAVDAKSTAVAPLAITCGTVALAFGKV